MPPTLKELALKYMREQISSGRWGAAYRLSDLLISKDIGISRTPVREAINQLVAEGLAEMKPHDGAFVKTINLKDIEELYELRMILECHCAGKAAANASDDMIFSLEKTLVQIENMENELSPGAEFLSEEQAKRQRQADLAFHQIIIGAANNGRLDKIIGESRIHAQLFNLLRGEMPVDAFRSAISYHRRLLAAIKAGNVDEARLVMKEHLESALAQTIERFAGEQTEEHSKIPPALRKFV